MDPGVPGAHRVAQSRRQGLGLCQRGQGARACPPGGPRRAAPAPGRRAAGAEGHHRYRRHADRAGRSGDLPRPPSCRRRGGHAPDARAGRGAAGQEHGVAAFHHAAWPARNPHDRRASQAPPRPAPRRRWRTSRRPFRWAPRPGGSIVRPSTFCGAVGFKPTIDTLPYAGLRRYSRPLDTLGAIARSVADLSIPVRRGAGRPLRQRAGGRRDFTVGVWRPLGWDDAEPCVREAFDDAVARLQQAGVRVKVLDMPKIFHADRRRP